MAKRPKNRGPVASVAIPKVKKIPQSADPIIGNAGPLSWKFRNTDNSGPFSWSNLVEPEKVTEVVGKLREFEGKNCNQMKEGGSHPIPTDQLHKTARARLAEIKLDEFDELMSLRLTGANRVWAYWLPDQENIMRLLWWDPEHQVYPVEKDKADRKKRRRKSR